jgi:hypothetical protein
MHRIRSASRLTKLLSVQSGSASTSLPVRSIPKTASFNRVCAPFSTGSVLRASVQSAAGKSPKAQTTATPPPEMGSSLDSIVPKSLFDAPFLSVEAIQEPVARRTVEVILTQLRTGIDASTQAEVEELQENANNKVLSILQEASAPISSLHQFTTRLHRSSKDPRRTPIAVRLFEIAFGMDPLKLEDPTGKTFESDSSLSSFPDADKGSWAAGYSWASLILSGQAQPPAGAHLLQRGSKEYTAALARQQAAAVRIYATLSMKGDPQGMLGMGLVIKTGLQHRKPTPEMRAAEIEQISLMRDRTIGLWTKAGELGVSEAYFELGLLYLGPEVGFSPDEAKARHYFENGAKADNFRCHHALGVLKQKEAMADNQTPSTQQRLDNLSSSLQHFKAAALKNDPQSAHNLGLRYLLRDEMVNEISLGQEHDGRTVEEVYEQARKRHEQLWGVWPDDVESKKWFQIAADLGECGSGIFAK